MISVAVQSFALSFQVHEMNKGRWGKKLHDGGLMEVSLEAIWSVRGKRSMRTPNIVVANLNYTLNIEVADQ